MPFIALVTIIVVASACATDSEAPASTPSAGSSTESSAAPGASPTVAPTTAGKPAQQRQSPAAAAAGNTVPVSAGSFTYAASGETWNSCTNETTKAGPASRVDVKVVGTNRRTVTEDQRNDGSGQVVTSDLEQRDQGSYLRSESIEGFGASAYRIDFEPKQPVLVGPANPAVGTKWSYDLRSKDGAYTVHATSEMKSLADAVTLADGSRLTARRIDTTTENAGAIAGAAITTTTRASTWITESGVLVKRTSKTTGTAASCNIRSELDEVLKRLP